ncbi:MAG: peptidylprolyl isomerase [Calditrichaeota bacterium]|nr:peptidylprolyl isomerase [Calditrichota bacterium]
MTERKVILLRRLTGLILVFQVCLGCNRKQTDSEPDIVAQVGARTITAQEFRLNYEFGFAHLKKTPDKKLSYLECMINETLLSMEGYRLGLDKTERVQDLEARLLQELLVEELLRTQVSETITVSDEEIRDAITRSKVRWRLRYWVEPDFDAADRVHQKMQRQGYANVVQELLTNNEVGFAPKDFETDYLTWLDVPPELLDAIKNLQIGEISNPIELNQVYFLMQVIDIRSEAISEYDYQYTHARFEQILFHRKLKSETTRFISEFMTPKNVVVKGGAFRTLADALAEWQQQNDNTLTFSEAIAEAGGKEPALQKLQIHLGEVLATFDEGRWSLKDFIGRIDPARLKTKSTGKQRFREHLKREIAITVRNYLMAKEAASEGLHKSPAVQNQLRAWRDKWVYEEMRRSYLKRNGVDPPSTELANPAKPDAHLEQTQVLLEQKIELLKKTNTVRINETVLDTISVTDFEKSRWANVFLFKNSSRRLAVPTVDPAWR